MLYRTSLGAKTILSFMFSATRSVSIFILKPNKTARSGVIMSV